MFLEKLSFLFLGIIFLVVKEFSTTVPGLAGQRNTDAAALVALC